MDEQRPAQPPEDGGTAATGQGDQALLTLALRLLASRYPGAPQGQEPQYFPGRVPDNLPFAIPLPDEIAIVGSVIRAEQGIEIVADTPLLPDQIRNFYQTRMTAAGWSTPDLPGPHGGFTPGGAHERGMLFCQGTRGPALEVGLFPVPGAQLDLRLRLITDTRYSPCAHTQRMMTRQSVIPDLSAPPGAYQHGGGGSWGGDSVHSTATLETDLPLAHVTAHYAAQLEAAGWSRSSEGQSEPQAWSSWSFTDEEGQSWVGLFSMLQLPEAPRQYFLQVYAHWTSEGSSSPRFYKLE